MAHIDYNEVLADLIAYLESAFDDYSSVEIGLAEPEPFNFTDNAGYIKVEYGVKLGETGKYGTAPSPSLHFHSDYAVPLVICCNKETIEESRAMAHTILAELEQIIRTDIQLGGAIEFLMRGVPRGAIGADHTGTEYRLTLTLDLRFQVGA